MKPLVLVLSGAAIVAGLTGCGNEPATQSTTGTGGAGVGGSGGMASDPGPPPQVTTFGGKVLAAPKIQPIFFAGEPTQPDVEKFLGQLAKSAYWTAVTSEYGVGPLTILPSATWADAAPASIDDDVLLAALDDNLAGA